MRIKKILCAALAGFILASGSVDCLPGNGFYISAAAESEAKINYVLKYSSDDVVLTITPSAEGNKLYYTTDGTKPNKNAKIYKKPLRYDEDTKVRIVEYSSSGKALAYATVYVELRCIPVDITIVGLEDGKANISLSTGTEGASIYYTLDGTKPKKTSNKYKKEFLAEADSKICAYAVKSGYKSSKVTELDLSELVIDVEYDETVMYIFDAINKERKKKGLSELTLDPVLTAAACKRAEEISKDYSKKHTRPNGENWKTVLLEYDYETIVRSENIGRYSYDLERSAEEIVKGWMNSETHRKNILSQKTPETGIGWVKNGKYYYFVQIFCKSK